MSIFRNVRLSCPVCATPIAFSLVISVNADRRPDLRDAILDGSFQRQPCPSCGTEVRADPEFTYVDIGRRQFLGVWPADKRGQWREWSRKTRAVFEQSLGRNAPREAREIGAGVDVRAVFGWPALVEKILARGAGIDDRTLELVKLVMMRTAEETPVPGERELRLVELIDDLLVFAWVGGDEADTPSRIRVPRELVADIDADPATWQAARDGVGEGDVVDFQRDLLQPA